MNTIQVKASKEYSVIIGNNILPNFGSYVASVTKAQKAVIISDDNVWPLYGDTLMKQLEQANLCALSYVFPAGEESKNTVTYLSIQNFLAENRLTRSDVLIALGGGVVGDMTGFVAATYLRGISYIQVPTTLLAMVDSSVGGKTAIDLPAGKNLVGSFYQPEVVICDIDTLHTLPKNVFRDGCAEIIKYAILYDNTLFEHLHQHGLLFDREAVISRCITWKRDVVSADEFDRGARQKLNLGHTIGHSIETLSNFSISHGSAVSIGMAIVARSAFSAGLCNSDTLQKITDILGKYALPTTIEYSARDLCETAMSDKKRSGNSINLIIPESIGNCIMKPFNIHDLQSFIEAGL